MQDDKQAQRRRVLIILGYNGVAMLVVALLAYAVGPDLVPGLAAELPLIAGLLAAAGVADLLVVVWLLRTQP